MIDFNSNRYTHTTSSFTKDQANAYDILMGWINAPFDKSNFSYSLIGPAGTGKTYLLSAIITNCNLSSSVIGLAAPTHKACRVLQTSLGTNKKVNTIASDLGYSMSLDLDDINLNNPKFVPTRPQKISNYRLYIIDEASMLPKAIVQAIEKIARQKQIKIIYCGDASQLPPVSEHSSYAFSHNRSIALTEIVRQGEDNPISELLEILRYDVKHRTHLFLSKINKEPVHFNDGNTKGYECLNYNRFINLININFSNDEITKDVDFVKIVAYTNARVNFWNKYVRNTTIKDSEKAIITKNDLIMSYVSIVDQFMSFDIKNSEDYIIDDIVNFTNAKTGIKGYMVKFQAIHGGARSHPLFVVDHNDQASINQYYYIAKHLIQDALDAPLKYRTAKWKTYYNFKNSNLLLNDIRNASMEVEFKKSIDYGFAITAHKSQGSTYDTVFVDLKDMIYDKLGIPYTDIDELNRRLYVACSRAKSKLYLLV